MDLSEFTNRASHRGRFRTIATAKLLLVVLVGVLLGLPLSAAGPLEEARNTLEQWVQTRQLISKEQAAWEADKELINQTLALYERELKSVEEKMSQLSTNNAQADKERIEAEQSLQLSNGALEQARVFAAEFEGQLAKLVPMLPVPLQEDKQFKALRDRLPSNSTNTDMRVTVRIQTLVGLLNEIDKFNNAVAIFSEKRKNPQGDEAAVETLYIGLGAAYFVNDADDFAGTGTIGPQGWEWTTQSEWAGSIREVIRIYKNERTARFVALPAVIR